MQILSKILIIITIAIMLLSLLQTTIYAAIQIDIDKAYIEYQDNVHEIKNIIVGIYNGNLSRSGKYEGLVGLDSINE